MTGLLTCMCCSAKPHVTLALPLLLLPACLSIRHTILLDDPFQDPQQLTELIPDASPPPAFEQVSEECVLTCEQYI